MIYMVWQEILQLQYPKIHLLRISRKLRVFLQNTSFFFFRGDREKPVKLTEDDIRLLYLWHHGSPDAEEGPPIDMGALGHT